MSLFTALNINASGLTAERQRAEVAAQNLANAQTTRGLNGSGAYRRQEIVFQTASVGSPFDAVLGRAVQGVQVAGLVDDPSPFDRRLEPTHPDADKDGYVSYPNVNSMQEMANMMSAARSYEANIAAINIVKTMINRTLEIGR